MDSAFFRTQKAAAKLKPPILFGYRSDGELADPRKVGSENPPVYAPAGTVHITMGDYAKYLQWCLKADPKPVLTKQETIDHLQSPHSTSSRSTKYGCGWTMFKSPHGQALQHAGSNTNSYVLTWILPEKNLAVAAMTNTYEKPHFEACNAAIVEMFNRHLK